MICSMRERLKGHLLAPCNSSATGFVQATRTGQQYLLTAAAVAGTL